MDFDSTPQSLQTVEKRRVDGELSRTRQALLKSEELLNSKERLMSPTTCVDFDWFVLAYHSH
jgi:hypothetical protein